MIKRYVLISACILLASCQTESEQIKYYNNGSVKNKYTLVDNLIHGKMYEYYQDGEIKSISEWSNGKPNGQIVSYFPNEKIKSISYWSDSLANGSSKEFYENGQLKSTSFYSRGYQQGEAFFYYPNGKLMEKQLYTKNGKLFYYAKYDNDGKKRDEMVIPILKPLKDTISIDEEFKGTVSFGIELRGKIKIFAGHFEGTDLIDTTQVLSNSENNIFSFSVKPEKKGKNTFSIYISHTTDKNDTLSVDGIIRKHTYFVND